MTTFVTREQWGARKARGRTLIPRSAPDTAHYGGPSPWGPGVDRSTPARFEAATDHARCASIVRAYQAYHMDHHGWTDIAYSSCVCPHDYVYEGRGPGVRTAANGTNIGNASSHATCYLAGDDDPLTDGAKRAFLHEDARLGGLDYVHSDWKGTGCPGDPTRRWVKAGHPAPGGSPTPAPIPPQPPTQEYDMADLQLVKGDKSNEWYLTDMVNGRRHQRTVAQAARAIWNTVAGGGRIITANGAPVVYPEADLADLPVVGRPEPVEARTELRVEALHQELERLTREVTAWKAAVDAAAAGQAAG